MVGGRLAAAPRKLITPKPMAARMMTVRSAPMYLRMRPCSLLGTPGMTSNRDTSGQPGAPPHRPPIRAGVPSQHELHMVLLHHFRSTAAAARLLRAYSPG